MDQLMNAGKQFLSNQGGGNEQGQQQQQGGSGGGGGFDIGDIAGLVNHAQSHDQTNSGDNQLFGQVASFLQSKAGNVDGNINEQQLIQHHDKVNNSTDNVNSGEIGNAAALSAIKKVLGTSGGTSSSGNFQQQLIGAAMAQAGNLFDQKSTAGQASGNKEDAMQQAGQAVMKLLVKNQVSGMIGGGSSSGLSGLMKLVV